MSTKFSEKDIEKALNYLCYHHPERATREGAIQLLGDMKVAAKDFGKALKKVAGTSDTDSDMTN
jgi:hypothetical protein